MLSSVQSHAMSITQKFGRKPTDKEWAQIQEIVADTWDYDGEVTRERAAVYKELRIPKLGWRIPLITRLHRFCNWLYDTVRRHEAYHENPQEPWIDYAVNLKKPEQFMDWKKAWVKEATKHWFSDQEKCHLEDLCFDYDPRRVGKTDQVITWVQGYKDPSADCIESEWDDDD